MNKVSPKITEKRFFRRIRSKLKEKLRNDGQLTKWLLKKYNLMSYQHSHPKLRSVDELSIIEIPKKFCLIKDHTSTIAFLNEVDQILSDNHPRNLHFDHTKTEHIGLAASFLFDSKIKNHCRMWRKKQVRIGLSGRFSRSRKVNNFLVSFGLLDELKVKGYFDPYSVNIDYKNPLNNLL